MKYTLNCDNDGHWYVVPVDKEDEFRAWYEQYESDDYYDNEIPMPEGVEQIGGSYTRVQFESYVIV